MSWWYMTPCLCACCSTPCLNAFSRIGFNAVLNLRLVSTRTCACPTSRLIFVVGLAGLAGAAKAVLAEVVVALKEGVKVVQE
uniref:Secreted protein n=1 Tax=Haemonchus placei TaxID=6290 RepID=A0A0N4X3F7_HAEPC